MAAGGLEKACDIIENYYVESIMLKPGEIYLEHKADSSYVKEMRKANFITACCVHCWTFLLIVFILVCGFPGLLHLD